MLRPFMEFGANYLFLDDETMEMKYITKKDLISNSKLRDALSFCNFMPGELDFLRHGKFNSRYGTVLKMANGEIWVYTSGTLFKLYKMYGFGAESVYCDEFELTRGSDFLTTYNVVFFIHDGGICSCVSDDFLRFGDGFIDVISGQDASDFFKTGSPATYTRVYCGSDLSDSCFKRLVISRCSK